MIYSGEKIGDSLTLFLVVNGGGLSRNRHQKTITNGEKLWDTTNQYGYIFNIAMV